MSQLVPPNISLAPLDRPEDQLHPDLAETCRTVGELGFTPCGIFTIPEFMDMCMALFLRESDFVMVAVYEHPLAGVWMDFCLAYADGGSLTVTNAPTGGELDERPGHDKHYITSSDPAAMLALLMRERQDKPVREIVTAEFPRTFREMYADDAAWRNGRGVNRDEVARVAMAMDEEISDYAVDRTTRRYEEPALGRDQAWNVLINWPSFDEEDEIPQELVTRFEQAADYFIHYPDQRCLPVFLRCLAREEDDDLAVLVTEVFAEHPPEEVTATLVIALSAEAPMPRFWAASLACSFPDPLLTPRLIDLMEQTPPLDESFQTAMMALEEIAKQEPDPRIDTAIRASVTRSAHMAGEMMEQGDPVTAFLILLSVLRHLEPEQLAMYRAAKEKAAETGFPVEEMEDLHAETRKYLDQATQ